MTEQQEPAEEPNLRPGQRDEGGEGGEGGMATRELAAARARDDEDEPTAR